MKKESSEKNFIKYWWKILMLCADEALTHLTSMVHNLRSIFFGQHLFSSLREHTYWIEVTTEGFSEDSEGNSQKLIISVSLPIFNVWNTIIFLICEKLLAELHPNITCIAGSKQHIANANFEAKYVYRNIYGRHRYQFWTILHLRN